mmetsp:Transcript_29736/g.76923  ORF Transcript_29736/g.76923 Transcript_29736/m.76923 type:complete len:140 (+) Transcript_29736:1-420(+)
MIDKLIGVAAETYLDGWAPIHATDGEAPLEERARLWAGSRFYTIDDGVLTVGFSPDIIKKDSAGRPRGRDGGTVHDGARELDGPEGAATDARAPACGIETNDGAAVVDLGSFGRMPTSKRRARESSSARKEWTGLGHPG